MKRISYFLSFTLSLILLGCSTPQAKFIEFQNKVDEVKKDISENKIEIIEKAKGYAYATDYVLSLDTNLNKFSSLAKEFSSRTVLTLGEPSMEEVRILREIASNLLSSNQDLIIKGEKQLKEKDEEVVDLQNYIKKLSDKLEIKEEKLKEVNQENAQLATTWKKITHGFWWIVWIVAIGFILSILGKILPPPYNNIAQIVGIPIGFIIKLFIGLIPSIKSVAGVVAEKTHEQSQLTLEKLVLSIEELKKTKPEAFDHLEPILKNKTDSEITRPKIMEVKKDYGLV